MSNRVLQLIVKAKDESAGVLKGLGINLDEISGKHAVMGGAALAASAMVVGAMREAVAATVALVNETATLGDEYDKMSLRTSVGVENLSEWSFVMARAGNTNSDFEAGVRRMTRSMYDYTRGLSASTEAWDLLGVSPIDAEGNLRNVHEVLLELADVLHDMPNETERLGVSQDILGRGASRMVATLAQGRPELERQIALLHRLNGAMSEEYTDGAAEVIDAQEDMRRAIAGLKAELVEPFLPYIAIAIDNVALSVGALTTALDGTKVVLDQLESIVIGRLPVGLRILAETGLAVADGMAEGKAKAEAAAEAYEWLLGILDEIDETTKVPFKALEDMPTQAQAARAELEALAQLWDVEVTKMTVDPETGIMALVPQDSAALAAAIMKAYEEAMKIIAEGPPEMPVAPRVVEAAPGDGSDPAPEDSLLEMDQALMTGFELEEQLKRVQEAWVENMKYAMGFGSVADEAFSTATGAAHQLTGGLSQAVSGFLLGSQSAIMFGRMIKTVLVQAVVQLITKLIVAQVLSIALGLISGGASTAGQAAAAGFAAGGRVPKVRRAAYGYSVPEGRAGLDSVGIMAMPGEEVIDRSLSRSLAEFLAVQRNASAVTPTSDLAGGGGGGITNYFEIGRPVSPIEAVEVGENMQRASEYAAAREVG